MPLKKIFFVIILISLIVGGFVCNTDKAFSYSGNPTHFNLAKEMVELYNLIYDPDISSGQLEQILRGSMDEDTPPRWTFHLYDPIYNRAPFSEFGIYTAKEWALASDVQKQSFVSLASIIYKLLGNDFEYHGDYSWPASVEYYTSGDSRQAYYGLGHVLHLIGDMSVPAHSRNDHHINGDPLESWAAGINYSSDFNSNLAENLYKNNNFPEQIYTVGQAFDDLSEYSNLHFFSKDTILSGDYYNPVIVKEREEDFGKYIQRIYAIAKDEHGKYYRLAYQDEYVAWNAAFHLTNQKVTYVIDEYDSNLQTDYWTHLAPKAVQYGASVIKLFLDQVGIDVTLAGSQNYSWARLPETASVVPLQINQGEVKGVSTENAEQSEQGNVPQPVDQVNKPDELNKPDASHENNKTNQETTIVIGPALTGDGWSASPSNEPQNNPPVIPPQPLQEPQDTMPPDVSIKSLVYDYPSELLKFEWIASESNVVFNVEYKFGNDDWNSLLINTNETQASLIASTDNIIYYLRVGAADLAGNQSQWEEASFEVRSGPSKIEDLAVSYSNNIFITLQWTAPYENGAYTSSSYDIRYSQVSITDETWELAESVSSLAFSQDIPKVENPETIQIIDITPLKFDTTYYFALKTSDGNNTSQISNVLEYSTDSPPGLMQSAWPTYQRDAQNTGYAPYSGPGNAATPSMELISDIGGSFYAAPVIDNEGILYIGNYMSKFYAIDSKTKEIKWIFDATQPGSIQGGIYNSASLASDGTIYFSAYGGTNLFALTPTGKLKWKYNIAWPNDGGSSPIIGQDGTIYISAREQGVVYAINPDGTEKWNYQLAGIRNVTSPVIDLNGNIYIAWLSMNAPGYVLALDSEGSFLWQSEDVNPTAYHALSINNDNTIYVGGNHPNGGGALSKINPVDGTILWKYYVGRMLAPPVVDINGNIYAGCEDGNYYIFDTIGNIMSTPYTDYKIENTFVVDYNGNLYFASMNDGKLIAFDSGGLEKWTLDLGAEIYSSPIIDENGILYIATGDGKIWAIGD